MRLSGDRDAAIRRVERLASVSVCISCLELLARRKQFEDPNLLNWPISQLRYSWMAKGILARPLNAMFAYPAILVIIWIRLLSAVLLLTNLFTSRQRASFAASITLASTGLAARNPYGQDGADQMTLFTFGTLTLANLCSPVSKVKDTCLWFLAAQSCLSYFVSGVSKATSPAWRMGSPLPGIFRAKMYGNKRIAEYLQARPVLAVLLARSLIIYECLFPFVLIFPRALSRLGLLAGIIFHTVAALTMGLNTFLWSFIATYPAVDYCSEQLGFKLAAVRKGCSVPGKKCVYK
jgi:hypothetical protein